MRFFVRWPTLPELCYLLSYSSFACLLIQLEDRTWRFIQRAFYANPFFSAKPALASARAPSGDFAKPAGAGPRVYVVNFQLTLAELRHGHIAATYVAPGTRLFETDELNVIWAELVDEFATSPYRLGLEIVGVDAYPSPQRLASFRGLTARCPPAALRGCEHLVLSLLLF